MSIDTTKEMMGPSKQDLSLLDLLTVFVENLRLLVLGPLLVGGVVTLLVYFLAAPRFTSTVKVIIPQPPQSLGAGALSALGLQGLGGGIGATLRNPSDIYRSFLSSNRVRDELIKRHDLSARFKGQTKDQSRESLGRQVEIVLGRDGIMTIAFTDTDPQRAADIANSYPVLLQEMLAEYATTEASLRRNYFKKQVEEMRGKIKQQEIDLKQTGLSVDMLKLDMNTSVSEITNLKTAITSQEIRLRALAAYLAPTAPEYKLAQGELNSLQSQLRKVESTRTSQNDESSYPEKYRSYLYDLQLLENLIKQAELAQLDANKDDVLVQVMDAAEPAQRKSGPSYRNTLLITALITGFLLLIGVYSRFGIQRARHNHPEVSRKFDSLRQAWSRVWWRKSAVVKTTS